MFSKNIQILIADDMKMMRHMVRNTLKMLEYTNVTEVENGAIGLQVIEKSLKIGVKFYLIISDWNMPELTGIAFLKAVRAHPKISNTPFILLTAENERDQIIEAIQLKVSAYIVKPFTQNILQEKLEAVHKKITQG
jgi:two-component system chemotaxis response regulator CheY